jgi:hypothetical protein
VSEPKHDPTMHRLRGKLRRRKREATDERNSRRKVGKARKRAAYLEHRIAKAQARRHGLDHEAVLDGTPMPLGQKLCLLDARMNGWDGVATSGDRRDHPPYIVRLLKELGKSTQAELYYGWIHHLPGFLPANPPTQGSHMRLGDGVVGAVGEILAWFREGLDSTYATQLREILNRLGYDVYRPYDSESEEHHTNWRTNPHDRLIERGLV